MSPDRKEEQIRNRLSRVEDALAVVGKSVAFAEFGEDGNLTPKACRMLCKESGRLVKALAAARMIAPDIAKLV